MKITALEFDKCIMTIMESTLDADAVRRDMAAVDKSLPKAPALQRAFSDRIMGAVRRRQEAVKRIVAAISDNLDKEGY